MAVLLLFPLFKTNTRPSLPLLQEEKGVFFEGERRLLEYQLAAESMAPYAVSHATYMKVRHPLEHSLMA